MHQLRTVLIFVAITPAVAVGQWSLDGYVATFPTALNRQASFARLLGGEAHSVAELTRLRLRPSVEVDDRTYVRMEVEVAALYVSSTGAMFGPESPRGQLVDLTWEPVKQEHWSVTQGIDRLFVKTMVGPLDVTVGRQRIAWGAGRTWNPTDLFNPINPASFSKIEKDGVDAMQATARIGDLSDLSAVWNPQRHGRSSGALRARTNWEGFDGAVMAGRYEDRWVFGGDITGSIWDAGVRAEAIHVSTDHGGAYQRWIIGVDNQFTGRWYGMAEFLWNGEGVAEPTRYELGRLLAGQILHVAQRYMVVQSSYLIHPLVTAQASLLKNLDDGSGIAGGTLSVSLTDEAAVALGCQVTFGRPWTEYWLYPSSAYLRADLFF
jgi:hypothetical protein